MQFIVYCCFVGLLCKSLQNRMRFQEKSESGFSKRGFSKPTGSYAMRPVLNESCVSLVFGFTNVLVCFAH